CLDTCGSGYGIELLFSIERRPLLVKLRVVAIDIPEIATGPHDVMPSGALCREQCGDVVERAPRLCAKIANVDGLPILIDAGSSGNQQDDNVADINTHSA